MPKRFAVSPHPFYEKVSVNKDGYNFEEIRAYSKKIFIVMNTNIYLFIFSSFLNVFGTPFNNEETIKPIRIPDKIDKGPRKTI